MNSTSCSSDDDNDFLSLQMIKTLSNNDPNSYESLCKPSKESCELCEHVSNNKYKSLIHNVRHIIIPLINQSVVQCGICLHHFSSQPALNRHISEKHHVDNFVVKLSKKNVLMVGSDVGPARNDLYVPKNNETLKLNLGQENVVNKNNLGTKTLGHLINKVVDSKYDSMYAIVKKEKIETIEIKDEFKKKIVKSTEISQSNIVHNGVGTFEKVSLKNRLLFEEDISTQNCDQLLTDLTTDCKVKVECFSPIWKFEDDKRFKSIHYDELVKPGLYSCKKCRRTFPSRYEAIMHESKHFYIKKSQVCLCELCDRYIIGDIRELNYHKRISHSDNFFKPITEKKYFGAISQENGALKNDMCVTNESVIKLCNLCFASCKKTNPQSYECVGEMSDPVRGKTYKCYRCLKRSLHVLLVNRKTRYHCGKRDVEKKSSNEHRLKMIVKRFKMMK